MRPRVFISHSALDAGAAIAIARQLRERGFKVWYTPGGLTPGAAFVREIIENIMYSQTIVLVSANSVNSSWVEFELSIAQWCGVGIVPVLIDPPPPPGPFGRLHPYIALLHFAGPIPHAGSGVPSAAIGGILHALHGFPPLPQKPIVRWRRILLAVNLALFTLLLGFVGGTGFVLKAAGWQRHNFIFDSAYLRIDPAESNAKMNLYFYHPSEPIASPPVLLYRGNEAAPVPVEAPRLPPVPAKDRQILHYDSRLFDPVDSWTASFFWSVAEHLKYGPFLLRAGADTHLILTLHTQKATRVRIGLKDDQGNEAKIDLSPIAGWGRYAIPLASFSGVDKNRIVFFSIAHESKLTPAGPDAPGDPEGRLHVQIAEIDFGSPGAGIAPTPTP